MTTGCQKFRLLLWKNFVLQKRHKLQTVIELLVPLIMTAFLLLLRKEWVDKSKRINTPSSFPSFRVSQFEGTMLSAGCAILFAPKNHLTEKLTNDPLMKTFFPDTNYIFQGYKNVKKLEKAYKEFNASVVCGAKNLTAREVLAAIVFTDLSKSANKDWNGLKDVSYSLRFPLEQRYRGGGRHDEGGWLTDRLYPRSHMPGPRENVAPKRKNKPRKNKPPKMDEPSEDASSENATSEDVPSEDESSEDEPSDDAFKARGGSPGYWGEGFLYLQHAVDSTIRKLMSGKGENWTSSVEVELQRMPYPKYVEDPFIEDIGFTMPLFIVFSFIYPVINIAKAITVEKEKRLKESMKMMGLPNYLHWLAWFLKCYIFITISLILLVTLLKIKIFYGGNLAVLTHSDGSLIFVFFLVYAWSMITLAFLISTLFSSANSAALAAGVLFFLSYLPSIYLVLKYDSLSKSTKLSTSLVINTGLGLGCKLISMWEGVGGVQWSSMAYPISPDDNWSFLDLMMALFIAGLIHLLPALYIEGVWPGEFGIPLPWYFPCTKRYWCGTSPDAENAASSAKSQEKPDKFENEPESVRTGVQIQGLTKIFKKKTAVNNLYLNFYDDQITVLLGHNGAGKTTTMSMLTGLFPPTSGTALVNGYDIRRDMKSVRESLGLCPQHDVLFDEMTVAEHLKFFAKLKGCSGKVVSEEVNRMLKGIDLEAKKNVQSHKLSGGMKRRLSVGIAFIGGSKVVLLDEPSSGLDPGARRQMWDLIQFEKKDRTIILSTHFMDEADVLGDRIAIMAEGTVQCCGSPLFLKKKYGGGYHLVIVKQPECDVDKITEFLRKRIPQVEINQNVGSELSYSLPDDLSHLFADMFKELEAKKDELGIASYGASITTMEEVFMKVGKEAEEERIREEGGVVSVKVEDDQHSSKLYQQLNKNSGCSLLFQQLRAMIVKKFLYTIRNKVLPIVQTLLPIIFLVLALLAARSGGGGSSRDPPPAPALDLSLKSYRNPITITSCSSDKTVCGNFETYAKKAHSEISKTGNVSQTIIKMAREDIGEYTFQLIVGFERLKNGTLRGLFNNQPFHAPPIALNLINNALLSKEVGRSPSRTIRVKNHPLPALPRLPPPKEGRGDKPEPTREASGFEIGFFVSVGMSFLAASFVVFPIKERETNAKHLQVVSGVKYTVFWIAAFIFDSINFVLVCIGLLIVLLAFQNESFKSPEMAGLFFLVLVLYGWSVIPLMYLFSFALKVPAGGFMKMALFNMLSGMITTGLVGNLKDLIWLYMLFPNFDLAHGIEQLSKNKQCQDQRKRFPKYECDMEMQPPDPCCDLVPLLAFRKLGIGRHLFAMLLIGFLCFFIILVMESKIFQRSRCRKTRGVSNRGEEEEELLDSDVKAENLRIRNTELEQLFQTDNLVLRDLTKVYGKFTAVDSLCLGVQKGECFGLLGKNGAGKSTTFKMLTGDIRVTSGDAFVHGNSIRSDIKRVQKELGYCPQFDALIPELTGRETIRLFARLRGVKEAEIGGLADDLGSKLLFTEHMDKPCGTYSGGNKRKLSTAVALVGNPPIVLLDEPTTGMDPVARRHLWDAISDVREAGTSIVLTSHSMDECEALSTRLAVMVNGAFRCLGSTQHLKNKFGDGYTLIAQIATGKDKEETKKTQPVEHESGRTSEKKKKEKKSVDGQEDEEEKKELGHQKSSGKSKKKKKEETKELGKSEKSKKKKKTKPDTGQEDEAETKIESGHRKSSTKSKKKKKKMSGTLEEDGEETKITQRESIELGRRRSSLIKQAENTDKLQQWERDLIPIRTYIETTFLGCELKDVHAGYVHYHIKDKKITWGFMFRKMEEAKEKYRIQAYSVGQTTLEQVFLNFTKGQVNIGED